MKQQGATWITAEGKETLKKFIPPYIQLHERLGQKISSIAVHMEEHLRQTRVALVNACREALRNNPDKSMKTRFTWMTFDHEYKIEFDLQTEHARIYQATKKNPSAKDYRLIDLNITSVKAELGTWDDYIKSVDTFAVETNPTPGEHYVTLAPITESSMDGSQVKSLEADEIGMLPLNNSAGVDLTGHPGMMPSADKEYDKPTGEITSKEFDNAIGIDNEVVHDILPIPGAQLAPKEGIISTIERNEKELIYKPYVTADNIHELVDAVSGASPEVNNDLRKYPIAPDEAVEDPYPGSLEPVKEVRNPIKKGKPNIFQTTTVEDMNPSEEAKKIFDSSDPGEETPQLFK